MSYKQRRSADKSDPCEQFTLGDDVGRTFLSPGFPNSTDYAKNITCVKVIEGSLKCQCEMRAFYAQCGGECLSRVSRGVLHTLNAEFLMKNLETQDRVQFRAAAA